MFLMIIGDCFIIQPFRKIKYSAVRGRRDSRQFQRYSSKYDLPGVIR